MLYFCFCHSLGLLFHAERISRDYFDIDGHCFSNYNCKNVYSVCFQSTNRIKEYAQLSRNDRYLYVLFIAIYFALGGRDFYWLIIMDILSKLIITVWGMFRVKDMLRVNMMSLKEVTPEIVDNINIGSKLMLSSIASMLIMGTIRFLFNSVGQSKPLVNCPLL